MSKILKYFILAITLHISFANANSEIEWNAECLEIKLENLESYQTYRKEEIMPFNLRHEFEVCAKKGNVFCSKELADYYYFDLEEYHHAFPHLKKHAVWLETKLSGCEKQLKDDWTDLICKQRTNSYLMNTFKHLAIIYFEGDGVLQDYDKSIYYGKLSANSGDSYAAYMVYLSYLHRTKPVNKSKNLESDIINAYAWLRVALAMGVKTTIANPKTEAEYLEFNLNYFKRKLISFGKTKDADSLALSICNSIEGCNI